MRRNRWNPFIQLLLASLLATGCSVPVLSSPPIEKPQDLALSSSSEQSAQPSAEEQPLQPTEPQPPVAAPIEQRVILMAVGDIMVHQEQLDAAWDPKTKSYQFQPFFAKVQPLLQKADLVIGNLETTLAGQELRYTGYPMFNSPESLAFTLKQAGFTAVTTANNHSLDRKEKGVLNTIAHLDKAGLKHTGTFRSAAERNEPLILEKNGIKLGVVAYTYGTNGIPIPKDKPYLVNLINPALMKQDIARARQLGADLVAVALHFGAEYQRKPNDSQYQTVNQAFSAGADIVLGHHPHVLQPYEWREITMADGSKRRGLVIYSLGNFISAQRGDYKDVGGILKVVLKKTTPGNTVLESAELIPTYVVFTRKSGKRSYVIYPLADTLQAYHEKKETSLAASTIKTMERLFKETSIHVSSMISEKKAQ